MHFWKWLRVTFIVLLTVAGILILSSFLSRRQLRVVVPESNFLSPEISYRTTEFEYADYEGSRLVFTVRAQESTETVARVHSLRDVKLTSYGDTGEPADVISGHRGTYDPEGGQIELLGDVEIELVGGTHISSNRVQVDLKQEVVVIDESFRFQQGPMIGEGRSMIYRIRPKEIQIGEGFQLDISSGNPLEVTASEALYDLSQERIQLVGEVLLLGLDMSLSADRTLLLFTKQQRLREIRTAGHARLDAGLRRSFSGQEINLFFSSESQRPTYFEVLAGRGSVLKRRATYEQKVKGGAHHLEANCITAVPWLGVQKRTGLFLQRFVAEDDVSFKSSVLDIQESSASSLVAFFAGEEQYLEQLDLRGGVRLLRVDQRSAILRQERLYCQQLNVQLKEGEVLDQAIAKENVDLELNSERESQHFLARDMIKVQYREGMVARIEGSQNCRLQTENKASQEVYSLRAPYIEVFYEQGLLDALRAHPAIEFERQGARGIINTSSQLLEASFQEGRLLEIRQLENFHLWEVNPSSTLDMWSDRAVYNPGNQVLTVMGDEPPVLRHGISQAEDLALPRRRPTETVARRFHIDQKTGKIIATGGVRTEVREAEETLLIVADFMEADPKTGWVDYRGNARILQEKNSISGERLRYHSRDQELVVDGRVRSLLLEDDEGSQKAFRVEADRLVYQKTEGRARYRGHVRLQSEHFTLRSPFADLLFPPSEQSELKEIIAWGGVRIQDHDREAKGQRAVYSPGEEKVVLTGEHVQVSELSKGSVVGTRLTFYLGDDRLVVEGPTSSIK